MKLITKMASFGAAMIAMMLIVIASSWINLSSLRTTLIVLGNEDMPLSASITEVATGQLSQSAWMERALLAAELGMTDALRHAENEFESEDTKIRQALTTADRLFSSSASIHGADDSLLLKFSGPVDEIGTLYASYHRNGIALLRTLQSGDIIAAEKLLDTVQSQSEQLSVLLANLRADISTTSAKAANAAISTTNSSVIFLTVTGLLILACAIALSVLITRSILHQLGADPAELQQLTEHLASGHLDMELAGQTGVAASVANTVVRLREVISGIQHSADEVSVASTQVGQGNADLSRRTQEQASSLEEIAASMEEMTSTVNQNAENANQANDLAREATEKAEQGGEIASRAVTAMSDISDASRRIAEIINVIDDIAFQINLLALNAAVEAARAGDQGRGFAVVAGEVRNLAGRSATAAKQIKELIEDSVGKVDAGTALVGESGDRLTDIVTSIKRVSDNIAEIATASREQSDGINQVNRAILQMDDMTQQNASLVEEAAAASETVDSQARRLKQLVSFFNVNLARVEAPARPVTPNEPEQSDFAARLASRLTPVNRGHSTRQPVFEDNWEEF